MTTTVGLRTNIPVSRVDAVKDTSDKTCNAVSLVTGYWYWAEMINTILTCIGIRFFTIIGIGIGDGFH